MYNKTKKMNIYMIELFCDIILKYLPQISDSNVALNFTTIGFNSTCNHKTITKDTVFDHHLAILYRFNCGDAIYFTPTYVVLEIL